MNHLLTDLGGFLKSIHVMITFFVYPLSRYLYYLMMIKRLYLAKTTKNDVFLEHDKSKKSNFIKSLRSHYLDQEKIPEELKISSFKNEIKHHKYIKINFRDRA